MTPPANPLLWLGIATGILLFAAMAKWSLRSLRRKLLALSVVWALTCWFLREELVAIPMVPAAAPRVILSLPFALATLEALSAMWHYRGRVRGCLRSLTAR